MVEIANNFIDLEQHLPQKDMSQLLLKRIKLLAKMRVAWLRNIWTQNSDNIIGDFTVHHEIDGYLSDRDLPELEAEWQASQPEMQELAYLLAETEEEIRLQVNSRFKQLGDIFGLNQIEMDIVQLCFCQAVEPNLGRIFAYLQDNSSKNYVTESLTARLFRHRNFVILKSDSPLKKWAIIKETFVHSGEQSKWEIDPFIRNWLLGFNDIDESLSHFAKFQSPKKPLPNWPLKKAILDINRIFQADSNHKIRVFAEGVGASGRKTFAACICQNFGLELLAVDSGLIPENKWVNIYMLAHRQARLSNAAIIWYNEPIKEAVWPINISPVSLQFVVDEGDSKQFDSEYFINIRIVLPKLNFEERLQLWQSHVPHSKSWPQGEFENMVLSHETSIGKIVSIGRQMTPNIKAAYEALQADSRQRLGSLAQLLASHFIMDDLVLSPVIKNEIENFIFEATERTEFWEQNNTKRLFPQGKGLIGLFTGNPGTGKTMAAQVIANSLKLELYRIDLSSVISKYIGESSKNIEKILKRAQNMNVVLFFDEADSLFGKRTDIKDSHDRYANTDTNYLLQEIENYPGIIILASNKVSNIDNGFMRRFRYLLDFREPDAAQRLLLWEKILRELIDFETVLRLKNDLKYLADHVEITGAQIKQSILSAIFLSRKEGCVIATKHLLGGIERELIKTGKSLNKRVFENIVH